MITKLEDIKGVGKATLNIFRNHNIWSTYDLFLNVPKSYDFINLTDKLIDGEISTVKVLVLTEPKVFKTVKVQGIKFKCLFKNKEFNATIFQRTFLKNQIIVNKEIVIKGKYDRLKKHILVDSIIDDYQKDIVKPIYQIDDIRNGNITKIIKEIVDSKKVQIYETLPKEVLYKRGLIDRFQAYLNLHLPNNNEDIKKSIKRLKYEEAFFFQKKILDTTLKKIERKPKSYNIEKVKRLISKLPYELTLDQKNAVNDIFKDFKNNHVFYRLIQGDVGSGKTVVSALAIYGAITSGEQVAFMAPTELLAKQHYEYLKEILDVRVELLTSKVKNKREIKEKIKTHEIDLIIGTHALIQDDVEFSNLGLVVIDEQHKFGVKTRAEIIGKAQQKDVIYLTATPIPRTLALSYFDDVSVSVIKNKPSSRKPVKTVLLDDEYLDTIKEKVIDCLSKNEKAYIVVPAIESDHVKHNINSALEWLKMFLDEKDIFVLHGKLSNEEQNIVMDSYLNANKGILLATTMIEVGIDVKEATLMIILNADYFGLSQIHQLRGRVGRNHLQSYCYLVSSNTEIERLKILEKTNDGFLLSEYDLKERGPGSLLGKYQSGFDKFKYLNFFDDFEILKQAKEDYQAIKNKEK